jgi:DNA helicase-2/ATP-dependent DNA helicase PcrA
MSEPSPVPLQVQDELRGLADVQERLRRPSASGGIDLAAIVTEMERIRDEIPTAQTDERAALILQYERLGHIVEQAGRSGLGVGVDPRRPYFAHMRLLEDGRERDVFLGKATRLEEGLRIVDWRNAPVSRLFYRHQEGDDYDESFAGRELSGTLVVRRTVAIVDGELQRVQCPQGHWTRHGEDWIDVGPSSPGLHGGEGAASWNRVGAPQHGSGRHRLGVRGDLRLDKRLPDVSALLDPAQFELVSSEDAQLVVLRGVAGSGKTTVGLHRLAFLNYADPKQFRPERMLVVVWGRALRDYISRLLESLGLAQTPVMTFESWASELRRRLLPFLPGESASDTPAIVSRLKLHPGMLPILEDHIRSRPRGARSGRQVADDWLHLVADSRVLTQGFATHAPGAFSESEIRRVVQWTSKQVGLMLDHLDPERAEAPLEPEDPEDREGLEQEQPWLDAEDDALLLRLWQLRIGPLPEPRKDRPLRERPLRYAHVMIDEVQDLSPLEVRVLMDCTDERRSLTLAGDTQQHVLAEAGFADWEQFFSHLGVRGSGVSTLRVSYRCTRPILEFARAVLGPLVEDEPPVVPRDGVPVEVFGFAEHGECLAFLVDSLRELLAHEPHASIGVLARTPETADLYFQGFDGAGLAPLRRVEDQDFAFSPGIDVTDVIQAKGLEFDYVVLLDVSAPSYPDTPSARRILHVGATRAAHQLWVTSVGPASPLLP